MLIDTNLPNLLHRGKVRDTYALGDDRLLMVATDRISAFDVVLPTGIPGKGVALNRMSAFWFQKTRHLIPNHFLCLADGPDAATWADDRAALAGATEGMKVLDIGSGIGGPARTLAAEYGCDVTGIDLTEEFCLAAEMLTGAFVALTPTIGVQMFLAQLTAALDRHGLILRGGFHPVSEDAVPDVGAGKNAGTVLLIGNAGPGMWQAFAATRPLGRNPLDRWTRQVVEPIARRAGGTACYPADGPPYHPFQRWAQRAPARDRDRLPVV